MPAIALLVAAASATVPACAQSSLPGGTQPARALPTKVASPSRLATVGQRTVLRNVTILRGKTSVEVHIEASGPLKPVARVFSQPERIVVDLAGVSYDSSRRLSVNAGDVEGVRIALFQVNPPVTRVVVDLARRHQYRLLPAGSTVILAIDTSPKPAIAAQPAAPKVAAEAAANAAPPAAAAPSASKTAPAPAPASAAKLEPPPMASHPNPPNSGVLGAPAKPEAPAPIPAAQPSAPTVSATLPQVATLPVPTASAQPSAAAEEEGTTPHQAAKGNKPGVVRSVTVLRGKDAIEVHIEATKPLRASASTLSHPERIIVDLANVRVDRPRRIPVNAADVQAVDCSLYLVNPLVTRVVVNLARAHPYHLLAYGNSLIVKIEANQVKTAGSQPVR